MNQISGPKNPFPYYVSTPHDQQTRQVGQIPLALLYSAIAVSMVGVLIADLFTPLGVAIWIVYLVPVTLSLWAWRPEIPLYTTGAATLFILVTLLTDAPGMDRSIVMINRTLGVLSIWVVGTVGYFFIRYKLAVAKDRWLQSGQTRLSEVMRGEQTRDQLVGQITRFLCEYLSAHAAAVFTRDGGEFRRISTYGVSLTNGAPEGFMAGEGLLGQAVKDARTILLDDVPDNYLLIESGLIRGNPRHLVIVPVLTDEIVNTVMEIGFLNPVRPDAIELLERVCPAVGVAIRSANYRTNLQNLLEETQRQAEELQAQGEELRVSNEELEEQSRALRETQSRLVQQQAELEETNVQLEEQTQLLESQRDDLASTQSALQLKARELEQSSRYKSDFLANMSHELRTPLNSSLILARLLADNVDGNLSADQVRYAETILSSGNDLLSLINDILDLSKIEAGRMDMRPENVRVEQLLNDLSRVFEPLAQQKGLDLQIEVLPGCPDVIFADRQRLEQVLKNLVSNAVKFTEQGRVSLTIKRAAHDRITFAVTDTGIGIAPDQQEVIFEAFRQADGTTSRKYGGTGLGLSISRELTRLLAGELHLTSQRGEGSTFWITLPVSYDPGLVAPRAPADPGTTADSPEAAPMRPAAAVQPPMPSPPTKPAPKNMTIGRYVDDDRARLTASTRILLVVEDDEAFARILYDLAHEQNFQCLIASTAEDAIIMAVQYLPSAVVLDIGLPDHSGLTVLDRLKHDSRTRHIPVHVVSADDFAEPALSLGAVGFLIKPVNRDALVDALQRMETKLSQRMQRVLVVEDDAVQLDSLRKLLASQNVATEGVQSAAECLERLKNETFDCMVLDLTLPDATGYSLLETLSQEEAYSFPPVIVYTGRDLSATEEQQLRRYSKSIIIKGAKSPERLLDEVTLFLHQVVSELPAQQQKMLEKARSRDALMEGRRILIVEDDVRNIFALTSILEQRGAITQIARNGREALTALEAVESGTAQPPDLVLMDVMMPEMDGLTATSEIRKRSRWKKLPIIMLTAKAMKDDQENCLAAGANDYMSKPLDVEKLLSLIRVWITR